MKARHNRSALLVLACAAFALAACNTPDALDLRSPVAPPAAVLGTSATAEAPAEAAPATADAPVVASVPTGPARVQIAPIVGAPSRTYDPLSARLTSRSNPKRFTVVPEGDASATHTLKGFFSASQEGGKTVVFYVWDVIDRAGNRVHRFSGQEAVSGTSADGWSVVSDGTINEIADRTAEGLGQWLTGAAG